MLRLLVNSVSKKSKEYSVDDENILAVINQAMWRLLGVELLYFRRIVVTVSWSSPSDW